MDLDRIEKLNKIIEEKNAEIQRLTSFLEKDNKAIQELKDFYEGLLALTSGNVFWVDRNNVFLGCNDLQAKNAKLMSRKDIVGKTNYDMPWKDQAPELNKLNNLVMDTGKPHSAEEYAVMANGLSIYLSNKSPIRDNNNAIIGVLGHAVDITEQKKIEAALRLAKENADLANRAKTEFIANTSHDIRPPLKGLIETSRILEERAQNQEEKDYAHWIYQSGKQLLKLLNGLLNSIASDINNDVRPQTNNLRNNIQDIIHLLYPAVKINHIDLKIEIEDCVPEFIVTDAVKLNRVLSYLIGSVINYSKNGSITLKIELLSNDNGYVQLRFSVINTGLGIPLDLQDKIFDPKPQSQPKDDEDQEIDLLCIAQKYVGLLGGEIKLFNEPGKGAIFSFTLSMKVGTNV